MNTWENIKQEDQYNDDDSIDADHDEDVGNDAEGVWSPDIEQSFQEALAIYPPCGRRKIILSEEGKMYGRNELIARYIKLRTGKTRTRKQVSSHIQVLAKRKTKDLVGANGGSLGVGSNGGNKQDCTNSLKHLTSAQIISPQTQILSTNKSLINISNTRQPSLHIQQQQQQHQQQQAIGSPIYQNGHNTTSIWPHPGLNSDKKSPFVGHTSFYSPDVIAAALASTRPMNSPPSTNSSPSHTPPPQSSSQSHLIGWHSKCVGTHKLRLIEFSGFFEQRHDPDIYYKHLFVHLSADPALLNNGEEFECIDIKEFSDKFPDSDLLITDRHSSYLVKFWVDLNYNVQDSINSIYAVTNIFESNEPLTISCSTKVCSFGNQVVEKVESEHSRYENGRYVYRIENSPMCEYMIQFINKLKQLPEKNLKNSVLENFSVLQLVRNNDTQELLLCLAYVFEVSTSEHGAQHVIYRLTK